MTAQVSVRLIALHVTCHACRAVSRLTMREQVEDWYAAHFAPDIVRAEVITHAGHRYVPVERSR